uniref:Mediator of RNA polymerase II transcription subunit 8 n=1 Tax=Rhabditophanes sp. KR3021 TaxID=114890 RepID=A0AC35U8R8_9BILA
MSRLLSGGYQHEPEKIVQSINNLETKIREIKFIIEETLAQLSAGQQNVKYEDLMGLMTSMANAVSQMQKLIRRSALEGNVDDQGSYLSNHVLAPQLISMDFDPELYHKSEGRIPYWNHDVLPDYLRTKLMPSSEEEEKAIEAEIASKQADYVTKQHLAMTKHIEGMLAVINEGNKGTIETCSEKPNANPAETRRMVMAIMNGTDLFPSKMGPSSSERAEQKNAKEKKNKEGKEGKDSKDGKEDKDSGKEVVEVEKETEKETELERETESAVSETFSDPPKS